MTRVGVYVRISDDRKGEEAGVGRQEQDCRRTAHARAWDVAEVYRENDTSAFTRRKVTLPDGTTQLRVIRPEFRRLLDDLINGRIDGAVVYHLDRVARDPRDMEDLIDATETTKRPVISVAGDMDLSTDSGRTMARIAVAIANQSSRDASRRIKRAKEENLAEGRWNGGGIRAYGYDVKRTEIIPHEAAIIRELADRTLAGQSTMSIITDLTKRGVPTVRGGSWRMATVRRILTSGVAAGRMRHNGVDVGPATWPAILDEDTHQRLLEHYEQRPKNDTTLVHWLSGVARCGRCGHTLRGNSGAYLCSKPHGGCNRIWVKAEHVEALVEHALVQRMRARQTPTVTKTAVDDTQLAELAELWAAQEISLPEYRAARKVITARLAEAKPVRLPAWVDENLADTWPDLTAPQRNAAAKSLLDGVVVDPCPDRRWRPERVRLIWR